MNKNSLLEIKYGGVKFLVEADINSEYKLEGIYSVSVWVDELKKYVKIQCDLAEFEYAYGDQLYEAVRDYETSMRLSAEDMAFEVAREERVFGD